MDEIAFEKVSVRHLPNVRAPIPAGGGRLDTAAGELVQIVNGPVFRFLAYLEFMPDADARRGNHVHLKKTEVLYVISGSVKGIYRDLDTGVTVETMLVAGDLVTVQPNCAHSYVALEYSQVIEIGHEVYDPMDTVPYDFSQP